MPSACPEPLSSWFQEDWHVGQARWLSRYGPTWNSVRERIVRDSENDKVIHRQRISPGMLEQKTMVRLPPHSGHVKTEFKCVGDPGLLASEGSDAWSPTSHQLRRLTNQSVEVPSDECCAGHEPLFVMEVFSPDRFTTAVEKVGLKGKSYDLVNGLDFTRRADRIQADDPQAGAPAIVPSMH